MTEAPLGRARLCLAVGDVQGAVAALEDAVARIPEFAEAHRLLGGLYLGSLDDYPRARRHLETALRLHRESGDLPTHEGTLVLSASLLSQLVDVERRRGDIEAADRAAGRLESIAREALALFMRLGARRDANRAAAVLRSLGVMAPTDGQSTSR